MGDSHFIQENSEDTLGSRDTLQPIRAKMCYFYKDEDYKFGAVRIAVHPKSYRKFDVLLGELSKKIPDLSYGVRGVFTPRGRHTVNTIDSLKDGGQYVCSTRKHFARGLDVGRVHPPELWHIAKPKSGIRELNSILAEYEFDETPRKKARHQFTLGSNSSSPGSKVPKKITVMKNGDPSFRHIMLLNRKTAQTFEQVLADLSDMFKFAIRKLFTVEGRRITGLSQLLQGPEVFVAAGKENFKSMLSMMYNTPTNAVRPRMRSRNPNNDPVGSRVRDKRDRLLRTRGCWKVWVSTNELSSAGTTSQVTLTVYGHKGSSIGIPLGEADTQQHFQSGQIDEFDISMSNIGEIYKIRIAHDNMGEFPGWLCDEVRMKDMDSGEELVFPCKRWLARDEDDHELCRELPAVRRGEPTLPLVKYEVHVTTGNLWNAGTDANVYLTIYGDRGDTGVRQLFTESRQTTFKQGDTDAFQLEAVSLGRLKRIIVGHDATTAGSGWFLERINIRDPEAKYSDSYNFHCHRWLDEGEDDGKIVRELKLQVEYMDDIMEKRNWEFEKWKFENRNQVMFFSHATGKALRIKPDGTVDGLGETNDTSAVFSVHKKKSMVHVFSSQLLQSFHLAIENGKLLGHGKGGPLCEFRVRVQSDQTVVLEAVKNPLQFIAIMDSGRPGDVRGILDHDLTQRFSVYCKGMFRHRGIVMLRTSPSQAISVDHDMSVYGTGKCNHAAHFRVHKVSEGVRMFESMIHPGHYLRLKDGKLDCDGGKDELAHFIVSKHRNKGYVVLQSDRQRGLYVGLTPQGKVHPTVDTGVRNVWLYPEVIEFGVPKQRGSPRQLEVRERVTPRTRPTPSPAARSATPKQEAEEGDWKIIISTSESLENGEVAVVAYGDKGCSGQVLLAAPVENGPLFQTGSNDEFMTNFLKCGKLYKIRLELIVKNPTKPPSWKLREVKMQDLINKELLKFQFNRWLSRQHEDGEIMRELPVIRPKENVLPVLTYVVEVTTGRERKADTDADIYMTVFGERGDTGKRLLGSSNNSSKFRVGQMDKFELEAVHLGKLVKIQIGHNATGKGDGWHLDKVIIREREAADEEYLFPCDRWFDSGMEDKRIERVLHVKEPAPTKIVSAMSRESSEYASEVVAAALEAATRNLYSAQSQDMTKSETDYSDMSDSENKRLEKVDNDIIDDEAVHSEALKNDDIVSGKDDDGDDNKVASEIDKLSVNDEKPPEHAQNDSDQDEVNAEGKKVVIVDNKQKKKYKDGDWKVWTTTGRSDDCGTKDEVVLFVYGTSGQVGPLTLGKGQDGYFKPGQSDEFNVHFQQGSKLGELYKVRVGLYEMVPDSGWYLEKIRMMNMSTNEEFNFKVNRWLSRTEDDHDVWRELAFSSDKQRPLPVNVYQIEVYTGGVASAGTDANVYLTVYGERGDTGKRKLGLSKSNKQPFQKGKVDVFDLEAVSLGELDHLEISHDALYAGKGWFLEKVVVKESSGVDSRQFYFPCDKWLDSGKEDKKIARQLYPADPPTITQGEYKLWIKTAPDSKPSNGGSVTIALYGNAGNSEDIALMAPSAKDKLFEPGNMDEFEVAVGDIGELYKVRVSRSDQEQWKGWHLQEVTLQDKHTREEYPFVFNRWMGRGIDDSDLVRELAVVKDDKPIHPVRHYVVTVHTGDHWAGETDAEVHMILYGSQGDTGPRVLYRGPGDTPAFRKGQSDSFEFEAVSLGDLHNLVIGHSGKGHGAGWFLDKVTVIEKDGKQSHMEYVFPCFQWLDEGEGDGATERTLRVIDTIDKRQKSPRKKSSKNTGIYDVVIKTSDMAEAGTKAKVILTLCGKNGDSKQQPLFDPKSDILQPGKEGKLQVNVGNIGDVTKIRMELDDRDSTATWRCDYIKLTSTSTGEELMFYVDGWLADDKDDGQLIREFALSGKANQMPHPALQYIVMIQTGQGRGEGSPGANVSINMYGIHGNTGLRPLDKSMSGSSSNMWRDGQMDIFVVPAVSVGKLQQVQLKLNGNKDKEWTVERVSILESVSAVTESVCHCNQTLRDDGQGCLRSFPISETQVTSGIPDDVVSRIRDRAELTTRGSWTALVHTGSQNDAGTKDKVMMVIYGTTGHTEPKHINKDSALNAGSSIKVQLNVGSIGKLYKIRVYFDSKTGSASWFLQKMKMKDTNTGEEFNVEYNDFIKSSAENPDATVELPLVRPDLPPLQDVSYQVTVTTGDIPVAETEAEVFCTLIGQFGDTGERVLVQPKSSKQMFRRGQRDEFEINTLDLGVVSKLLIGHNEIGRGCGWYCDSVTVVPGNVPKHAAIETIFLCHRWMDSGCEDRRLVRELTPLAHVEPATELKPAQRSKSKGLWDCTVTMATEDKLDMTQADFRNVRPVSLTVYGSRNMEGPIDLTDAKKVLLEPGQTHKLTGIKLADIGEIQKVRVTQGEDNEANPAWTIQQISLEDSTTKEILKFPFEPWVGEVGSDLTKEMPVIRQGQTFTPLVDYQITVYTSSDRDAGTYSEIFIIIHGTGQDCGRRHLRTNSDGSAKFQQGQVDVFTVSAVSLGDLRSISVTKGAGNPWLLDRISIKAGPFDNTEWIFEANRWVGSKSDQSREVSETLPLTKTRPSDVALPSDAVVDLPNSRGQWKVETVTGSGGTRGSVSDLVMILCGERGESSFLPLVSSSDKPFQAGQTDTCQVKLSEDLGEMFKVRLGFDDNSKEKAWNLNKIHIEDEDTHDCFDFDFDSWVAVDDNQDGWREFPIIWPAVSILPVLKYQIAVYLGDVSKPADELQLYIEVVGERGSTGPRQLRRAMNNDKKSQRNQMDEFQIEAVSVMEIQRVVVGHANREKGSGVFLKKVVIKEAPDSDTEYVFVCNRWLDKGEDDHAIERVLLPHAGAVDDEVAPPIVRSDTRESTPPPQSPTGHPWTVWTTTGPDSDDGTNSVVTLTLYGNKGHSDPIIIGEGSDFRFEPGSKDKFDVRVSQEVGDLYKIRVNFDGSQKQLVDWYSDFGSGPSWLPDKITLLNATTNKEYEFAGGRWIKLTDYADFPVEIPVYDQDPQKMLRVYKYNLKVYTGNMRYAGTDANVYVTLYGERGDSGARHLHGSYTNKDKFEQGQTDLFEIEAVDLGEVKKVKVSHDGFGAGSGWFLEKIVLEVPQHGEEKYVFNCGRWLDESQDDKAVERVLTLSEVIKGDTVRAGDWQFLVTTDTEEDSGTDAHVFLTVYGDKGVSEEIRIEGLFESGRTDHMDIWLDPAKIGKIKKIRLRHDDSGMAAGWRVEKVVMIDRESNDRLEFPIYRWLSFSEKYGDIAVEVPAQWPDETPDEVYQYTVQTITATDWGSGTDATVYINILGTNGDSGKRFLKNNLEEKNKFETGAVDTFYIDAVDLGRLESVVVGHDGAGPGSGWKLDTVTVTVTDSKDVQEVSTFTYGKWIDEDKDDKLTEVEIPLSDVQREAQ